MGAPPAVTELLDRIREGDEHAVDALLPLVYSELRDLAGAIFTGQPEGHTLQPTALVHEAWIKMVGHVDRMNNREHFFAVAARAMRQVLADHARAVQAEKRGGGARAVTLVDDQVGSPVAGGFDLVAFSEALNRLEALNPRQARVIELRTLGALTIEETARELGVSHGTVETDWRFARAWLRAELRSA